MTLKRGVSLSHIASNKLRQWRCTWQSTAPFHSQQRQRRQSQQQQQQQQQQNQQQQQQQQDQQQNGDRDQNQDQSPDDEPNPNDVEGNREATEPAPGDLPPDAPPIFLAPGSGGGSWGHLPPRLQQTLQNAQAEDLPLRYRGLLEQFHKRRIQD